MGSQGKTSALNYDEVLDYIGQFGKYQRRIFFLLWLVSAAGGLAVVVFAFTGLKPNYRCKVPDCDGDDATYSHGAVDNEGAQRLPFFYNISSMELSDRCRKPTVTSTTCANNSIYFQEVMDGEEEECAFRELVFDRSVMRSTIVEEFQLVCGSEWKRTVYSALYMGGMLLGSYLFGWISDTFGRLKSLTLAILTVSLSGFIGAFCTGASGIHGYGFLRFVTGMGGIGCFMVCFVLAVEHVGFKYTMLIGIAIEIPFAIGEIILGIEAYFIRDWTTLQIVAYLPLLVCLSLYWLVPESPRWLIGAGQIEEAKSIIRKASEVNGRPCPEHLLKAADLPSGVEDAQRPPLGSQKHATVLDLFRPSKMALRTLNMCFQWFSVTMCYYGLSFASTSLGSDVFVSYELSVFIEIPGYIFCIIVMDCWGRRPILSFCQIVSGISCVFCGLLIESEDPGLTALRLLLSLLGKFGASASFAIVYVYTAEMFPTVIRNQAVGTCSLVARIGGIISLLLDNLSQFWKPAPVFIMGCVATVAGGFAVLFPETLGQQLPDTMEDALAIGEDGSRGLCTCTCKSPAEMFREEMKEVPVELKS